MITKRPHILTYTTAGITGGEDENGFPIEGTPGELVSVPCRFHQDSSKVFKNEDSTETAQVGRIRLDAGVAVPEVGTDVTVVNARSLAVQFKGKVRERYEAQMSGRLEV
jgi:hypothetical protein